MAGGKIHNEGDATSEEKPNHDMKDVCIPIQ
jgi:hypothetical protein